MANIHVPIRAGTDIAFFGGIINYILQNEKYFKEYVLNYTNAASIVNEEFKDTEDLDGLFSGWNEKKGQYDVDSWQYKGVEVAPSAGHREMFSGEARTERGSNISALKTDFALKIRFVFFKYLKKHYSRYTPEMIESICGISA